MNTQELPNFVRDLVSAPPKRGEGLNSWLFRTARVLHAFRDRDDIVELLRAATAGEPINGREIERAVDRSKQVAWQPGSPSTQSSFSPWPKLDAQQREAVIAEGDGAGAVDLWEASPMQFDDDGSHAEEIVPRLFPGSPLVCCGRSQFEFATRRLGKWRGRFAELQFIVPSPMSARTGLTQDGTESEHTLANTGPRRFLVVEQDTGSTDQQAAILLHLRQQGRLALVVHSGGKSLHGWFLVAGKSEDQIRQFLAHAVALGADRATWTRSQFVRMPGGTRDDGRSQAILFFDPANLSLLKPKV